MKIIVSTVVAAPMYERQTSRRRTGVSMLITGPHRRSADRHRLAGVTTLVGHRPAGMRRLTIGTPPRPTVDLRPGGKFSSRMEAKDGSFGFDFAGEYTAVETNRRLAYAFGDRTAEVTFAEGAAGSR